MNLVEVKNVKGYIGENNVAYLNLEDVARGLGFTELAKSGNVSVKWTRVRGYLKDAKAIDTSVDGKGRENLPEFIPENIFYKLCMKANNEVARKFQDLVCDEILPSIRQNGGYIATKETDTDEEIMARALLVAQRTIERKNEKIKELETKVKEDKPKVLFADAVETSNTTILIGELAKIITQNGYKIGQNKLFTWLRSNGYLIKRQGSDYNMPTQKSMEMELFEIKETAITHSDGHVTVNKTPKVTGKGQIYFVNKIVGSDRKCLR